eukprot:CAMPEP_0113305754 /NCGR_PEP_ID=MMETSP0010_2-20120614/5263_1 /TAXON_ID=216773 ORGANISM="Corethron hystrix, Strain 308" /NCGR_SAMPLE_ID=MMETSP0010_2 /ASSEMBLY_ACC=CAM_ASM_000155 /LENGTH=99 /DNA_ID=CAMNT_0000160253 /DNA_START=153 /DNA_END=452 /DNA_ORIENTATION=- /assembly_acc=CAM_ASM_000155
MAFAPAQTSQVLSTARAASDFNFEKAAAIMIPTATIASPAFALDSIVDALPTNTVALEVQFGAYLAVLLGTFLPCLFLINLFIQTESRKAGKAGGQDSE